MNETHGQIKQAKFAINFIWWALGLGFWAGFALGAHVISVIGFNFSLGPVFYPYVQLHGQIQLIGWAGLFIIGISLHFIPRLAGVPLNQPDNQSKTLKLIVSGLILRFIAQSFHPYLSNITPEFHLVNTMIATSSILVWLGCLLYVFTIIQIIKNVPSLEKRPGLKSIRIFFSLMLAGWVLYPSMMAWLLVEQALNAALITKAGWNETANQIFLNLVLLPVCFAFSTRLLPLYLRLPAIDWRLDLVALCYVISLALQIIPVLPFFTEIKSPIPFKLSALGAVLKGCVILYFILKLDILTRLRPDWTVNRVGKPAPGRRATRPGLPDYGEYGSFEKLIYAAYAWLSVGATLEIAMGIAFIGGVHLPVSTDAIRHIYLLGFVTNLIFGIAPRMVPGLIRKKKVAINGLVILSFFFVNFAAFSRIVPLILPPTVIDGHPALQTLAGSALALSGIWGMAAIACLWINLRYTSRLA